MSGAPPQSAAAPAAPRSSWWGLGFAVAIGVAWIASLALLLLTPLQGSWLTPGLLLPAVALRTFLQTGLFIVGHDAMHGSLLPQAPRWNDRIGRLALALYAALPWQRSLRNHRRHHHAPAGPGDPDHPGGYPCAAPLWYLQFLAAYLRPLPMGSLLGAWLLCLALLRPHTPGPLASLLLFWTLPLLLSSLQLFVVGTYLPHRPGGERSGDRHRAASLAWPPALSLLACFHFGYHWEHHERPELPWYRLPERRRLVTVPGAGASGLALSRSQSIASDKALGQIHHGHRAGRMDCRGAGSRP